MPTLSELNVFSFDPKADIPSNLKEALKRLRAIEIIETIIKAKLESPSSLRSRLYFVNSRTGSGKSTLMISYLFHKFGKIICSQPRIVLTKTNALDVIRYNDDMAFGKNVSILNGVEKIYAKERVTCTYCTTQILSDQLYKMMFNGKISKGYKIIVVDECHVLDSSLLSLVSIVKRFLARFSTDPRCPLFLFTSATIDVDMMVRFFFSQEVESIYKDPTMIAYVKGSPNHEVIAKYVDPFKWLDKGNDDKNTNENKQTGGFAYYNRLIESLEQSMLNDPVYSKVYQYSLTLDRFEKPPNRDDQRDNKRPPFKGKPGGKHFKKKHPMKPPNVLAEAALSKYLLTNYIPKPQGDCLVFAPLKRTLLTLGKYVFEGTKDKYISFLVSDETSMQDVTKWRDLNRKRKRFLIVPYARDYSVTADKLLEYATEPDPEAREYELKIVISTPVLETGKTFSNLALCVDYGLQTTAIYNPLLFKGSKLDCIKQIPANKRQVIQRRGRVGRERPGEFVYFYTEDTYNALPENEFPATINNYVMTEVLMKVINAQFARHTVFDAMNINDFLYDISYDIMLRSIHDMIRFGLYSVHGELLNNNIDKTTAYIEYYYYVKGHTLFDSICFTKIMIYDLPDELSMVYSAPPLVLDFTKIPKARLIEGILTARNVITKLLYGNDYNAFPLIRNRII